MAMHKIILPLNKEPSLKSYTHNAYMNSILSSELVGGEIAARYQIEGDKKDFHVIEENCMTSIEKDITVKAMLTHENGYSLVHRKCNTKDSLVVKVTSRRFICAWELIGIVLCDIVDDRLVTLNNCAIKYGCPSGQKLFVQRKATFLEHENCQRIYGSEYYLKLERDELKIICSYSLDGRKWSIVYEEKLPVLYKIAPLSIGVVVEIRNDYMNWFCSNYIQLYSKYPCPGLLMIDYYTGPSKSYKTYYTNQFMDFIHEYLDTTALSSKKIRDYIYKKLLDNYYIITDIDHFYVPKTVGYGKGHYFHEVLIYGIDNKKHVYHVMAYGNLGIVFTFEMKFKALYQSLKKDELHFILGRINLNSCMYQINTFTIKKHLEEYLAGYNCEMDVSDFTVAQSEMAYGINVMKHILANEDELFLFCSDTRLSYVIYEHKRIMLERIIYLRANGFLQCNEYEEVFEILQANLKLSEIIKNNILRNAIKYKKKSNMLKIRNYLDNLIENEKLAYEKLIEIL